MTTDIKAYINGAEIPSCNVDGNMVIVGTDLRYYGFDVVYDNTARTSNVSLAANGGTWDPIIITNDDCLEIGTEVMRVYQRQSHGFSLSDLCPIRRTIRQKITQNEKNYLNSEISVAFLR